MCALGLIMFLLSAWVFLSVIWGINNQPCLGKPLKPFPERCWLSVLLLIFPDHHYRPALGLKWKKWADLAWRDCNPVSQSAFFSIWPWWPRATRWGSDFWQLAQGHPVQSKSGPCRHNTLRALWVIQLGRVQVLFVPNGKRSVCSFWGNTTWAAVHSVLPFPPNSYLVWAAAFISFITYH